MSKYNEKYSKRCGNYYGKSYSKSYNNSCDDYQKSRGNYYGKSYNSKPAYVYSLNLKGGKKYVGFTSNPDQRIDQHFSGRGAKWTQKHKPISVNHVQKCKNVTNAKRAETIVYKNMRDYHGVDKVRGAGHTKSY